MSDDINQPDEDAIREAYRASVALIPQALVDAFVPRMKAVRRAEAKLMKTLVDFMLPYEPEMNELAAEYESTYPQPPEGTREYIDWCLSSTEFVNDVFARNHPEVKPALEKLQEECVAALEAAGDLGELAEEFIGQGGTLEQWHDLDQAILCGVFSRQQGAPITVQRALPHPGEIVREDMLPSLGLDFAQAAAKLTIDSQRFQQFLDGEVDLSEDEAKEIEAQFQDTATGAKFGYELLLNMQKARAAHKLANPQFY